MGLRDEQGGRMGLRHIGLALMAMVTLVPLFAIARRSSLIDFTIYYGAGERVLLGLSPYAFYGPHQLPFQYVPWTAWLIAPLALLPASIAAFAFVVLNATSLLASLVILLRRYQGDLKPTRIVFLFAMALVMSLLGFLVGQITALQLIVVVLAMVCIQDRRPVLAGLLLPIALVKPHLILLFMPALALAGGRRAVVACLAALTFLVVLATLVDSNWLRDFTRVVLAGQARTDPLAWNFTTLSGLLGLPRNWNLALGLGLLPVSAWLAWRLRHLPRLHWLSSVLALSLFCAPYSFAYDLPLLIPALVMLSSPWSPVTLALWLVAALLPALSRYSSGAYLVTALVATMLAFRAFTISPNNGLLPRFEDDARSVGQ